MNNILICTPKDTYVIIEQIYQKGHSISLYGIGPELIQVVRRVLRVCDVQDVFHKGKRLSSTPNGWQIFQDMIGLEKLTTKPTGESRLMPAYVGFRNVVTPLPKIGNLLPENWTSAHLMPTPSIYFFGSDPIPNIQLYGDTRVKFTMPGGQPPATAIAAYYGATGRMDFPDTTQQEKILNNLVTQP